MSFIIGAILPAVTVVVFLGGVAYRIYDWRRRPSPPMTLYPAPLSTRGRVSAVLQETFLFKRLFSGDDTLWFVSVLFHAALAITLLDHYVRILVFMGLTSGAIFTIPFLPGGPTGAVLFVAVLLLLLRRLAISRVAEISTTGDYFALLLILGIVVTGLVMRLSVHFDAIQMREYFSGLLAFSYKGLPDNNWFILHYLLAQLLIMYIPFSKILHFSGIFFTQRALHKH